MGSRFKIRKVTLYHAVLFFIMTLPAFQMLGFDMKFMGSGTPSYIRILSLISFVLSLFLYVMKKLYRRQDIPIILYTLVFFLISMYFYLHHGNVSLSAMLAYVSVFYTVIIFARMDGYLVLDYIYCFFSIYWIMEFLARITPIKNSFTSVTYTFIGHIQIYSMMWVTYVAVSLLRSHVSEKRISKIWQILFLVLASVLTWMSGTSISKVSIIAMVALLIFFKDKRNNTNKILLIVFIAVAVLNLAIVFMNFQDRFANVISLFGDDTSLNGRTYIWSLFIPAIAKSPMIGNGYKALGVDLSLWGAGRTGMDYCHNTILQELANGGIIQIIFFVLLNVFTIHRIKNIDNNKARIFVFSAMVAMYIIMISESVTYFCYLNLLIALICNLDLIKFNT